MGGKEDTEISVLKEEEKSCCMSGRIESKEKKDFHLGEKAGTFQNNCK